MKFEEIISFFQNNKSEKACKGMARFKIDCENIYGISMPVLRNLSKKIGKNHKLALKLWNHGYHESRILAILIEDKDKVDEDQLEDWVNAFDTWDLCDQACINLFVNMPLAISKIPKWAKSGKEFVKRTAFSLIAVIAVHDKKSNNKYFEDFFPLIEEGSDDERNFVKKSVNWALRSIGKKNKYLNKRAIQVANDILEMENKAAVWIAKNAIKELESEEVQNRLKALKKNKSNKF